MKSMILAAALLAIGLPAVAQTDTTAPAAPSDDNQPLVINKPVIIRVGPGGAAGSAAPVASKSADPWDTVLRDQFGNPVRDPSLLSNKELRTKAQAEKDPDCNNCLELTVGLVVSAALLTPYRDEQQAAQGDPVSYTLQQEARAAFARSIMTGAVTLPLTSDQTAVIKKVLGRYSPPGNQVLQISEALFPQDDPGKLPLK